MSAVLRLGHPTSAADVRVLADLTAAQKALVPVSNYVQVGGIWVPEDVSGLQADNDYIPVTVDLSVNRPAPVEILDGGSAITGTGWLIWELNGVCDVFWNSNAPGRALPFNPGLIPHAWRQFLVSHLYVQNAAQPAGTELVLRVFRRI